MMSNSRCFRQRANRIGKRKLYPVEKAFSRPLGNLDPRISNRGPVQPQARKSNLPTIACRKNIYASRSREYCRKEYASTSFRILIISRPLKVVNGFGQSSLSLQGECLFPFQYTCSCRHPIGGPGSI